MELKVEIQEKPISDVLERKVNNTDMIVNLDEVQAIKNAIQEHLLFIGMDNGNNIKSIKLLSIGTSNKMYIDNKEIIRTALLTASEKVVLVHNHPSNSLKPSKEDLYMTNFSSKILKCFNIQMVDHIIITEKDYYSMKNYDEINLNEKEDRTDFIENVFLKEENMKLQNKIRQLQGMIQKKKSREDR